MEAQEIGLPADVKKWTNDDLNEALRRICERQLALRQAEIAYDVALKKAKEKLEASKKIENDGIKGLKAKIKKASERLRTAWENKSVKFSWGRVGFRDTPRHLTLIDGRNENDAIVMLEGLGVAGAVKIEKRVVLEVLERQADNVITAAGYRRVDSTERFEMKTKIEIEDEEPKVKEA
jgi:hypothetical protein